MKSSDIWIAAAIVLALFLCNEVFGGFWVAAISAAVLAYQFLGPPLRLFLERS